MKTLDQCEAEIARLRHILAMLIDCPEYRYIETHELAMARQAVANGVLDCLVVPRGQLNGLTQRWTTEAARTYASTAAKRDIASLAYADALKVCANELAMALAIPQVRYNIGIDAP